MLRYNTGKPLMSLLPSALIDAVANDDYVTMPQLLLIDTAQVLTFGAKKYAANNWRKSGSWIAVLDSMFRHMYKVLNGTEIRDVESGIPHAAHAMCNIGFLLEFAAEGDGTDDRYVTKREKQGLRRSGSNLNNVFYNLVEWKDGASVTYLQDAALGLAEWYEFQPDDYRKIIPPPAPEPVISPDMVKAQLSRLGEYNK